jgi:hypothetical protein
MRVLSIDAWADGEGGWTWNNWFKVGTVEAIPDTNRKILRMMRSEGYLSEASKGKVTVDDDGYNVVICEKSTGMPVFAIEYGADE